MRVIRTDDGWSLVNDNQVDMLCDFCLKKIEVPFYFEKKLQVKLCRDCSMDVRIEKIIRARRRLNDYDILELFKIKSLKITGRK
jgi:hypothetical protein